MRTHWGEPPIGNPARGAMLDAFRRYIERELERKPQIRSVVLSFAQYWADGADDAVHYWLVFSERETPVWPHTCHWDDDDEPPTLELGRDTCTSCRYDLDYWRDFMENGDAVAQVEACCLEGADQELEPKDSYVPYAIVRRTDAGLSLEIIGGPLRAWLDPKPAPPPPTALDARTAALVDLVHAAPADDAARQVLADHLLERGDPRGSYLTSGDAPTWLGPIAEIAPPEYVVLDRGFARRVSVHVPDVTDTLREARAWGSIEQLWFLPQSRVFFTPRMRSLRAVGPVDRAGLRELAKHGAGLPIEDLHVTLDADGIAALARLDLPRLRRLAVGVGAGGPVAPDLNLMHRRGNVPILPELLAPLDGARFWRGLEELVVMSTDPAVVHAWTRRPVHERPPRLAFAAPSPTEAPSGWVLSVLGREATLRMEGLGLEPSLAEVVRMIDAMPDPVDTVRLEPTRWYRPTDDDRAVFTQALSRPRTVV